MLKNLMPQALENKPPFDRKILSQLAPIHVPEKKTVRLKALDALRGIAALNVVLLHFTTGFPIAFKPEQISLFQWRYGAYGVHLFFLISGYVILMSAENAKRPRDFLVSRFSRLFPPYWAALVLSTLLLLIAPITGFLETPNLLRRAAVNFTMLQNVFYVGSVDGVYWTLGVEISFYFILLTLIWRRIIDRALSIMTLLVVAALVDHLFVPRPWGPLYSYLRSLFFLEHAYLFTIGMLIYKMRDGFKPQYVIILLLCFMCPASANYFPNTPSVDTFVSILLALIVFLSTTKYGRWLASRPLLYLGSISYSLYLTHHYVGLVFLKLADERGMNPNAALVIAMMMCLLLATVFSHFVERPSLCWMRQRLGDKKLMNHKFES